MPARTIATVRDLNWVTVEKKEFTKISDAVKYVKSYPCRGHVVYAKHCNRIIAYKSDYYGFRQL